MSTCTAEIWIFFIYFLKKHFLSREKYRVMSVRSLITSNEQYLRYQKNVIKVYLKITIYDVDDLFFVYIGNQNLLSKHDMWQSLLQFYKENNCVVNESDWP